MGATKQGLRTPPFERRIIVLRPSTKPFCQHQAIFPEPFDLLRLPSTVVTLLFFQHQVSSNGYLGQGIAPERTQVGADW